MSATRSGAPNAVRNPDVSSPRLMTKRAWWLVGLNVLAPGSAQVLAGNRKLGRFGLRTTFLLWFLIIALVVAAILARVAVLGVLTNSIALIVVQVLLVLYAVLWICLTLDTLRLARLGRAKPAARTGIALFAVVLMVVTSGVVASGAYYAGVTRTAIDKVFSGGTYADPIDGRYNILLLGGDAGPDRMGLRPDSISVISIDANTGATTIIGIPRNMQKAPFVDGSPLYGPYPNGYNCGNNCLISYLYTYGQEHPDLYPNATSASSDSQPGIEAMRDAAEGVLGITLQYYVLIDMKGFSDLIDALGGITITSTERLPINGGEDSNGQPINVDGWIEKGTQKMDGYTALWYARARHGTSDYDRMRRQRDVQSAILTQFDPTNVLTKFEAVAKAGSKVVKTDIPQVMLGKFVDLGTKAKNQKLTKLELSPPTVNMITPDFANIKTLVAKAIAPIKTGG
ncbi:LCP family protein [Glaciihabitans sp. dw_435]|uniref:LCP family protein n=1 Tax=Glaciihabitans sp. dw_435 TaxID=2720081 RepID=UPI0027DD1261|nr:LCP family protein [Glaciihabitans sp. dw_435]